MALGRTYVKPLEDSETVDSTYTKSIENIGTPAGAPKVSEDLEEADHEMTDREILDKWFDELSDDLDLSEFLGKDFKVELMHGMMVSNVAYLIARELNLDDDTCEKVSLAGILHDIGKLTIDRTYAEYGEKYSMRIDQMRYVRTHPTLGYAILNDMGFDKNICEGVLYHHENYDGTGYPSNKAGEDIPIIARVLRVSDVFSALISDRPYREAFDIDSAVDLMIDEVKHFDMRVFLAFQRVVQSSELIFALGRLSKFTEENFGMEYNHVQHRD